MKQIAPVLIVLAFFSSCGEKRSEQNRLEEIDLGPYETISFDPKPSDDQNGITYNLENVEFVRLSNDDLLNGASNLVVNDSLIYVIDKDENLSVSVFGRGGNFINKLEKNGKAADEYVSIDDVKIDKRTGAFEVLANSGKKLLRYDRDGKFIDYVNLSCPGLFTFYRLGDHYYFYKGLQACEDEINAGKAFRLTRAKADSLDKIEQGYLPFVFDGKNDVPTATINFINMRSLPNTNDTLVLFDQISDQILSITPEGVQARYVLEFEGEGTEKSKIMNDLSIIEKSEAIRKGQLTYLLDWLESDQFVMMQYSYFSTEHKQRFVSKSLYNKYTKQMSPFQSSSRYTVLLDGVSWDIGRYIMDITSSGQYVCIINPVDLIHKIDSEKKNNASGSAFLEIVKKYKLEEVKESDNPILMIFDFAKS